MVHREWNRYMEGKSQELIKFMSFRSTIIDHNVQNCTIAYNIYQKEWDHGGKYRKQKCVLCENCTGEESIWQ